MWESPCSLIFPYLEKLALFSPCLRVFLVFEKCPLTQLDPAEDLASVLYELFKRIMEEKFG
jgi:hypothetical protein